MKNLNYFINEAKQTEYRVCLIGCVNRKNDNLPVNVSILVDKDDVEAFEKYFAADMPAYVPRILPTPPECVRLIKDAGGIPILAHPTLYRLTDEQIESFIKQVKEEIGLNVVVSGDERYESTLFDEIVHYYCEE